MQKKSRRCGTYDGDGGSDDFAVCFFKETIPLTIKIQPKMRRSRDSERFGAVQEPSHAPKTPAVAITAIAGKQRVRFWI